MSDENRAFDVLITASEAYPRLEQEFLTVQEEVIAGFRVFDPWTKVRSDAARRIGAHWFDLITDTLTRGVRITLMLTDFDPVVRLDMHYRAWASYRALLAAAEASDHPENLTVNVSMHPARVGLLPRLALWPRTYRELKDALADLAKDTGNTPDAIEAAAPGLRGITRTRGGRLVPRPFPPLPLVPVTHHQKLAVFDGKTLYIGGLDLNERRFDTPDHDRSGDKTWHDVQVVVSGAAARDARTHLLELADVVNGARPHPLPHLLRTVSARRSFDLPYLSPRVRLRELAEAHTRAIARTEDLIYLETQFFRDEGLAKALCDRRRAQPNLSLILILPAAPEDVAFKTDVGSDARFGEYLQAKCIDRIKQAFGTDAAILSPAVPRRIRQGTDEAMTARAVHHDAPLVYLHAKVSLFDQHTGIVSSANLNGRSLSWDTEAGIETHTRSEIDQLRQRCFDHWLGDDADASFYDVATAQAAWRNRALQNAARVPAHRAGFLLPYDPDAGREEGQLLPGVPAEMV